ncbi:MAG TPA: hypothetical protein VKT22_10925 [Steroidobacteraceae bacterium]|nr:hypothetical protein [Steroidobacteraceae bacterium]
MTASDEIQPALPSRAARRPKSVGSAGPGFLPGLMLAVAAMAAPVGTLRADTNAGKLRIVNLYRGADGKPGAVDVYLGPETPSASATVTLPFGQSSAYLTVPSPPPHLLFYPARQRASRLYDLNLQQEVGPGTPVSVNGEQVTAILGPATTKSAAATVSVVREWSTSRFALYAPKPGIALVVGWAGAVQSADPQQRPAFRLGLPGKGCLRHRMPGEETVTAAHFSPFEAPKGMTPIAVYAATDERCSGAPLAGPRQVPTFLQGRTYVLLHGPTAGPVDLLALPIPYPQEP